MRLRSEDTDCKRPGRQATLGWSWKVFLHPKDLGRRFFGYGSNPGRSLWQMLVGMKTKRQGGCSTKDKAGDCPRTRSKRVVGSRARHERIQNMSCTIDKYPKYICHLSKTIRHECPNLGIPLLDNFDLNLFLKYCPKLRSSCFCLFTDQI